MEMNMSSSPTFESSPSPTSEELLDSSRSVIYEIWDTWEWNLKHNKQGPIDLH